MLKKLLTTLLALMVGMTCLACAQEEQIWLQEGSLAETADGAVLLLVIDGRQTISLGCTWIDMIDIFLEFGAVNASNLDGGSSSQMIYNDETLNINASVIGLRPLPTTFLVSK